jgi:hypothetical protein
VVVNLANSTTLSPLNITRHERNFLNDDKSVYDMTDNGKELIGDEAEGRGRVEEEGTERGKTLHLLFSV